MFWTAAAVPPELGAVGVTSREMDVLALLERGAIATARNERTGTTPPTGATVTIDAGGAGALQA